MGLLHNNIETDVSILKKETIRVEVISLKEKELLNNVLHIPYLDFALAYYYIANKNGFSYKKYFHKDMLIDMLIEMLKNKNLVMDELEIFVEKIEEGVIYKSTPKENYFNTLYNEDYLFQMSNLCDSDIIYLYINNYDTYVMSGKYYNIKCLLKKTKKDIENQPENYNFSKSIYKYDRRSNELSIL